MIFDYIINKHRFSCSHLARASVFIFIIILTGCDVFFIKKIDLEMPHEISQINIYEVNKKSLITAINNFALENSMSCRAELGVILYCEKNPRTLVAFEDKLGFTVCLFGIGMSWERNKFNFMAKALETSLINTLPNIKLTISLPEEMPECLVPQ